LGSRTPGIGKPIPAENPADNFICLRSLKLQGCIKLVNHNVAADVSRLKLSSLAQLFKCSAETNDPAHAGCYKNVAADVSRLKLSDFSQLFARSAENNDPAHAGCYEKR